MAALQDGLENSVARGWSSKLWIVRLGAGHGRAAAAGLLLILALCQWAGEQAWSPVRNLLFDAYQRLMPRQISHNKVVIVDVDDRSLAVFGRWPWPRTRLARLIEETHHLGAVAIGLDMIMPEADDLSPAKVVSDRKDLSEALRMDGVDIQAQVIENILDGTRLQRPDVARWLELLGFVVLALLLILFLPRLAPIYGVVIYLAGAVVLGLVSWLSFHHFSFLSLRPRLV